VYVRRRLVAGFEDYPGLHQGRHLERRRERVATLYPDAAIEILRDLGVRDRPHATHRATSLPSAGVAGCSRRAAGDHPLACPGVTAR
jgi:hypothetical protein